jgi:hypothetical protein
MHSGNIAGSDLEKAVGAISDQFGEAEEQLLDAISAAYDPNHVDEDQYVQAKWW